MIPIQRDDQNRFHLLAIIEDLALISLMGPVEKSEKREISVEKERLLEPIFPETHSLPDFSPSRGSVVRGNTRDSDFRASMNFRIAHKERLLVDTSSCLPTTATYR